MSFNEDITFGTDEIAPSRDIIRSSSIIDQGLNRAVRDKIASLYTIPKDPSVAMRVLADENSFNTARRKAEDHYNIATNAVEVPRKAEGFGSGCGCAHKSHDGDIKITKTSILCILLSFIFIILVLQYYTLICIQASLQSIHGKPST